jgi:glycosyltransferase involved in cell wall biosynthesis
MKIAMIGHKRIPSREGGVEICVEELSTRMAAAGHEITVYNRRKKGVPRIKDYKSVHIVNVPTINKKSLDAIIYAFFATVHALFGHYNVIHYHAEGPCSMLIIPHLFGIKTVATIHGLDWQRAKWGGFATKFLLHGEKTAARYADQVIVLSKNVQDYFKNKYRRDTVFIPNGISKPVIRAPDIINRKYGLVKDSYILFLARIVPEKGLHYLIEAFSQIDTEKKLVIAGQSSHSNEYVSQIKGMAAKDNRIIMTGFVQGNELDELYSNTYLYVLPSDIEGMPISLLEAMSYGCTCLVSDIPENVEVVQDCALIFKKANVGDLKNKLIEALNTQNVLIELSEKSKSLVLTKFLWCDTIKKTLALY